MKLLKFLLLVGVVIGFSGCAAKGTPFAGFKTPPSGKSNVYIYRTSYFGAGVAPDIHQTNANTKIDKVLGSLKPKGYLETTVEPGNYIFWARTEAKNEVALNIQPNTNYCVKHYISMGFLVGHPQFNRVDMKTCAEEIKDTKMSKE